MLIIWAPYISKKVELVSMLVETYIPFAAYDLQKQYTETEYVWFDWEQTFGCIFRSHVTTDKKGEKNMIYIWYKSTEYYIFVVNFIFFIDADLV